jgi:hypothetical protein
VSLPRPPRKYPWAVGTALCRVAYPLTTSPRASSYRRSGACMPPRLAVDEKSGATRQHTPSHLMWVCKGFLCWIRLNFLLKISLHFVVRYLPTGIFWCLNCKKCWFRLW